MDLDGETRNGFYYSITAMLGPNNLETSYPAELAEPIMVLEEEQ